MEVEVKYGRKIDQWQKLANAYRLEANGLELKSRSLRFVIVELKFDKGWIECLEIRMHMNLISSLQYMVSLLFSCSSLLACETTVGLHILEIRNNKENLMFLRTSSPFLWHALRIRTCVMHFLWQTILYIRQTIIVHSYPVNHCLTSDSDFNRFIRRF